MSFMEPPFSEFEERWFLAEILKHSPVAPGTLLNIISQGQVEPGWTQIAPPYGRSVAACQNAYLHLMSRQPASLDPNNKKMRPSSQLSELNLPSERTIQPRPSAFPSVNGGQDRSHAGDDGRPRKKRGRPSKEEHEQRVAEAALRGEVYPPPKKAKTPRPSLDAIAGETSPGTVMFSKEAGPSGPSSPASARKKKPQLKLPPTNSEAELKREAHHESVPQTASEETQNSVPGGSLPPPQQTNMLALGNSLSAEAQMQGATSVGTNTGAYQSPFSPIHAHPLSSAAQKVTPNHPSTAQY